MDLGIASKLALVSGRGSGIGWHTALLLDEGATVIISDVDQESLDRPAADLGAAEGTLHAVAADVTSAGSITALRDRVAEIGDIDIRVQSSGSVATT